MTIAYPPAERLGLVETMHGVAVADPYRWLEDDRSPATAAWNDAQDALVRPFLDALPGRDALRARLRRLAVGSVGLPVFRGDRVFCTRREHDQDFAVVFVREPDGTERTLLDPNAMSDDHTVTLDMWMPSPDGRRIAYTTSAGGDEETTLYVADVASGDLVDTPIGRTRAGSFAWLPGGDAYFYVRRLPASEVPAGEQEYHRRVWRRSIGSDPSSDEMVFGEGRDKVEFYGVGVSRDGRWLTVSAAKGNARINDLYVRDLHGDAAFATVIEGEIATTSGGVSDHDGLLYLTTNFRAPNRRVACVDPRAPSPDNWRDVVAESEHVLVNATFTADAVLVQHTQDVVSTLTLYDRASGAAREVDTPGPGSILGVSATPNVAERQHVWFAYTDFVTPPRIYRVRVADGAVDLWATPPGDPDRPAVRVRREFFESKDGTRVPLFVVHRDDLDLDGRRPTLMYGYGGWAIPQVPTYGASTLAWVEAGGVYALACIRGGSEYGDAWHKAGMRGTKQNVFDDFIAAGEWLCANDITSPEHLGIEGGSNGGTLVGACATQRPDLFASVVCSAPVLDMVRFPHMPGGHIAYGELGNPAVPEEFAWLHAYSPYHRVVDGTRYPAVLFTVFESDARVAPWHARKMCAAMQHATASDRPVLYRRERGVGHAARSLSRSVGLTVDTMSFHAAMLGLDIGVR